MSKRLCRRQSSSGSYQICYNVQQPGALHLSDNEEEEEVKKVSPEINVKPLGSDKISFCFLAQYCGAHRHKASAIWLQLNRSPM